MRARLTPAGCRLSCDRPIHWFAERRPGARPMHATHLVPPTPCTLCSPTPRCSAARSASSGCTSSRSASPPKPRMRPRAGGPHWQQPQGPSGPADAPVAACAAQPATATRGVRRHLAS
jgi:hypothetical protein